MTTVDRIEDRSKRTKLWYDLVGDDPHPAPDDLGKLPLHAPHDEGSRGALHEPPMAHARA
jgi:hypothetical protein